MNKIKSLLPEPWILGKALHSSPCMIISWLQLHRDLERKTYWLLVLFITNAWREMKHRGNGSEQESSSRMLYVQLHKKKASQVSAPPTDNLSNSALPVVLLAPLDYLPFQYVDVVPWTLQCQCQAARSSEQVQYFRSLNCTDTTYWGWEKGWNKECKKKIWNAWW